MRLYPLIVISVTILPVLGACTRSRENASADSVQPTDTTRVATAWTVRPDSFGPVPLGAPLTDARPMVPGSFTLDTATLDGCTRVRSPEMPIGTSFMVVRDSVGKPIMLERVDVDSGDVRTGEGAGIGDSETAVLATYGQRAVVQPHKYTGPTGHYVIVSASEASDTLHRIVFETDGQRVLRYHAGRRPAVDQVEGCG